MNKKTRTERGRVNCYISNQLIFIQYLTRRGTHTAAQRKHMGQLNSEVSFIADILMKILCKGRKLFQFNETKKAAQRCSLLKG